MKVELTKQEATEIVFGLRMVYVDNNNCEPDVSEVLDYFARTSPGLRDVILLGWE